MGLPKAKENTTQESYGVNTQENPEKKNADSVAEEELAASALAEEEAKQKKKRAAEKSAATKKANKEKKLAEEAAKSSNEVCEFGYASSTRFRYVDPGTGEIYHRVGSGLKPTLPRVENNWLKAQLRSKVIVRLENPSESKEN